MAKRCEWEPMQGDKGIFYITSCGMEWHGDLTKNCPICGKRVSQAAKGQDKEIKEKQLEIFS